jgi:hypothetical protein
LDEAEADRVHHHLQLTLPRIEREARARIAAKIAACQVCFQRSARSAQVAPLRCGAFAKRDLELRIASSFLRISIDDFRLKPVPTLPTVLPLPLGERQRRDAGRVLHEADDRKL